MRHKRFVGVLVGLILALALSAIIGMGVGAVVFTKAQLNPDSFIAGIVFGDSRTAELRIKRQQVQVRLLR